MGVSGFTHESSKSKSIDWYTPPHIFLSLGCRFSIDVCGPIGGVPWVPADRTYSLKDDGLLCDWEGMVWCNPPYGKETELWLKKMKAHNNGIALVFARTDTRWFHDYCKTADSIVFLEGRISFVDAFGKTGGGGPGSGSMLVGYGSGATDVLRDTTNKGRLKGMFIEVEKNRSKQKLDSVFL